MSSAAANVNSQLAARVTFVRLIVFSLALGILPLGTYFWSLRFWDGNATYAAITAVVAANIVLVAYIVVSLLEEQSTSTTQSTTETKKDR